VGDVNGVVVYGFQEAKRLKKSPRLSRLFPEPWMQLSYRVL